MRYSYLFVGILFLFSCSNNRTTSTKNINKVLISTNYGDIKVLLFDDTPIHKQNFLNLVDSGYYDSLLFHRVINKFMIQAGDPKSKGAPPNQVIGNAGPGYTLQAEIKPNRVHRKGALAAAREPDDVNPERRSSGSQFYIVTGRVFTNQNLDQMEESFDHGKKVACLQNMLRQPEYSETMKYIEYFRGARMYYQYDSLIRTFDPILDEYIDSIGHFKFTEAQREVYTSAGGAPHLDGAYTVFGQVVEGIEVADKIAQVKRNELDRPVQDVVILGMKKLKK